ncbi:nucleoprotein [Wolkberg virus]|uniref:Nucleoprotein n=1 Tax=Wolkberg virus TaxID=1867943 RepID=A0A1X9JQ13_9VIRU|nr:nucleoprotein [Wolkberg virus]AQM74141.1 nucleoprotein [Wolkberg virus]AQM74150.1 nucleoprotein [Wolkberg virus]AQM74153.1 nucleoprotein [Wolkberg virus]AQM74156.1 nucleoprotein [Wolkberg virus]AQM74159.1 nucleoprotein [Wolkberg virus]
MSDLVFYDEPSRVSNGFNPEEQYNRFFTSGNAVQSMATIRTFFLNAKKAKDRMASKPDKKLTLKFGSWAVEVINNHFPGNRDTQIMDTDLTLHRISGYLARYVLETYLGSNTIGKSEITATIVNPIAESHGIRWTAGAEVYLAFFPGTEMFLDRFNFYPLAIGIYRVKKGMMDAQFLKKSLRQRYDGMTADQWMQSKTGEVMQAIRVLETLPWGRSGLGDAARQFLTKFGITI